MTFRLHIEHTALAELVEFATASDGPWPECAALAYLSIRQDRALTKGRDHEPFPSLRELTATFRWVTRNGTPALGRVRKLLQAEERWGFTDERRVSEWRKLMGKRCRGASKTASLHAGCTPDARGANAEDTPATDEAPEPTSEANAKDTGHAQSEHTSIYTRVRSNPPILHSSIEDNTSAADASDPPSLPLASTPKPPSATDAIWTAYRDAWKRLHGSSLGKRPPAGVSVAARVSDHDAASVALVVEWFEHADCQRAAFLRENKIGAKTLFGKRKHAEYLTGFARPWEAKGKPRAVTVTDPTGRQTTPQELASSAFESMAALPRMASPSRRAPPVVGGKVKWALVARDERPTQDERKDEHHRRYRCLAAAGGYGAWCNANEFARRQMRAAFVAAYAAEVEREGA